MSLRARNLRRWVTAAAVLAVLAGCPKRFDPRAETVRASPDAEADHEYHEAKARLDIGDAREASVRFADFLRKHPNDPLAPSARIGQARAELLLNQPKKAKELLEPVASPPPESDPTAARARYLLGLALHKTGDWLRSREMLRAFVPSVGGDDAVELHAVLADDSAHLDDAEDALKEYSLFFAGARPVEKLYLRDRVSAIVTKLSPGDALRLWNALPHDTVAAAYLGRRVAADVRGSDARAADAILDESRGARERAGIEEPHESRVAKKEGGRSIALVLPLTGSQKPYGERALRGALLAADLMAPGNLPGGVPVELVVRDSGSDPARGASAVEDLARMGVAAVVGSPNRVEAQSAAPAAEAQGLPYLELAPDDARRGTTTFKMVRQNETRARTLARVAVRRGARSVAVLAPDSNYGRAMAAAFVDEARKLGARVAADLRYPERSTTFIEPVKRIQQSSPEALFVPAPASELQLIAPQLTVTGVTRLPGVVAKGRQALLYATADGLTQNFIASTAKYLEGAILAPVFYADVGDPRTADFVTRYQQAYGDEPASIDALAFDAVRAARIALEHADGSSAATAASLSHLGENGLTGELAFTAGGDRAGAPPLYTVDNGAVRAFK